MYPPQTPCKSPCRCRLELSGHYVNAVQLHVHAADVLVRRGIWRGLQIIQEAVGHRCDTSTAIYTNSRELHQPGEKPQVSRSPRARPWPPSPPWPRRPAGPGFLRPRGVALAAGADQRNSPRAQKARPGFPHTAVTKKTVTGVPQV